MLLAWFAQHLLLDSAFHVPRAKALLRVDYMKAMMLVIQWPEEKLGNDVGIA